jgi:hypothetical protein
MLKQNWAMARPAQPKTLKSGKKNWPKNAKIYDLLWAGPPNNCAVVPLLLHMISHRDAWENHLIGNKFSIL